MVDKIVAGRQTQEDRRGKHSAQHPRGAMDKPEFLECQMGDSVPSGGRQGAASGVFGRATRRTPEESTGVR